MKVAIIGATSSIAQETARCFAAEGADFFLVARDEGRLSAVAADLRVRGAADVSTFVADLSDLTRHSAIAQAAGTPDVILIAHGVLPDQIAIDRDPAAQIAAFTVNATSVISMTAHSANLLEAAGRGTIAVIGSLAGDRGRRGIYVYGSAKAAIHNYYDGLRARLAPAGVNVLVIKPGRVDTPMTQGMPKNAFVSSAQSVGRRIHRAIVRRETTVYVPWFWRWILLILRMLPARFVRF